VVSANQEVKVEGSESKGSPRRKHETLSGKQTERKGTEV
jgi:hypothetical protein